MKTAAIIQARMKSTRLPGKVLMTIGGQPLLAHIVARLRRAKSIDAIAITTSTEPEDDAIVAFGARANIPVFRGDEEDVLGRFAIAADALRPEIIVRVTGDSPLVDPEFVDHLITEMRRTGADFVMAEEGVKCIQEGVDPFSRRALRVMMGEARNNPIAREHVTGWIKANPKSVRIARVAIDPAYQFSGARLSVDTPADLEFFAALAERADLSTISLPEVAALLRREPWLLAINAHVHQKAPQEIAATVLIRADGGGALGYGHLTRMAALAEALRDGAGFGVVALTGAHPDGNAREARAFFERHKIRVLVKRPQERESDFIVSSARDTKASALVTDIRTNLPREVLQALRAGGMKIAVIDDASPRRLAADIAVYPPVPQVGELRWNGFRGQILAGPEWVLLPRISQQTKPASARNRLLVTLGGSDPHALSEPIALACAVMLSAPIDVVLGPGVEDAENIALRLSALPNVTVHVSPKDPAEIFARARLAISSFGVTAYELAHLAVPALYVALTEDHARSAEGAEVLGYGRLAAMADDIDVRKLAALAVAYWGDDLSLARMRDAGPAIDGKGAERVAQEISALIRGAAALAPRELARTHRPKRRLRRAG